MARSLTTPPGAGRHPRPSLFEPPLAAGRRAVTNLPLRPAGWSRFVYGEDPVPFKLQPLTHRGRGLFLDLSARVHTQSFLRSGSGFDVIRAFRPCQRHEMALIGNVWYNVVTTCAARPKLAKGLSMYRNSAAVARFVGPNRPLPSWRRRAVPRNGGLASQRRTAYLAGTGASFARCKRATGGQILMLIHHASLFRPQNTAAPGCKKL